MPRRDNDHKTSRRGSDIGDEYVWAVDSKGRVLDRKTRAESHRRGIIHRVVHVVVLDPKHRIFIKKRSRSKDMFPNQWEAHVGGHVTYGDNTRQTAARELEEELGIVEKPIPFGRFQYRGEEEKENITFFYVVTAKKPRLNISEATRGEYVTMRQLEKAVSQRRFVDGTLDELPMIRKLLSRLDMT